MMTSSSLTHGASLMVKREIPELIDFFKGKPSQRKRSKPSIIMAG
jgi:hypothetical protein